MSRNVVIPASSDDVVPQLAAFPLRPATGALADRNYELGRSFLEPKEVGSVAFTI